MKILIICSKDFYSRIETLKNHLALMRHEVFLPNCYDAPETEEKYRKLGTKAHQEFKARMFKQSEDTIRNMDAVLVLNYDKEKNGKVFKNYIGGATFLEMYDAFRLGKKIYLMNSIPEGILYDEIEGFSPVVLNGNCNLLSENKINESSFEDNQFDVMSFMLWLENFTLNRPFFFDDDYLYSDANIASEDASYVKITSRFYDFLKENISSEFNFKSEALNDGDFYKIQFNSVGYEIGFITVQGHFYVNKVAINNASDYFDINSILDKKEDSKGLIMSKKD